MTQPEPLMAVGQTDDPRPDGLPPAAAWRWLLDHAAAPYRQAGRFAWHFARGKLGHDPVFRALLAGGELPAQARVVDIGCGQGLLASLLHQCAQLQQQGRWPGDWPAAPSARQYTGIELMARDVARAQQALQSLQPAPAFVCADLRHAALPPCDLVVILDVLHYVNHAEQASALQAVRQALQQGEAGRAEGRPSGRLLLRVGDADSRRGFAISQWVDRTVTRIRGHRVPPTFGRPLADWVQLLQGLGFVVRSLPMSQGTPFANVLLLADLPATAAQPTASTRRL